MKTVWKFRNPLQLFFFLLALSFAGCKDSEDPDPRQAFVGAYEMDDFDVLLTVGPEDSLFALSQNPEIEFKTEDELDPDELKVDLDELITEVFEGTVGALNPSLLSFSLDYDDDAVVEISGSEFELDDFEFDLAISSGGTTEIYQCEINGEGELESNAITFEFEIVLFEGSSNYVFEGTAEGER